MMLKRKSSNVISDDDLEFWKAANHLFDLLDIDKDGTISIREAVMVLGRGGQSTESIERQILALDKNRDGVLSRKEFAVFCKDIPLVAMTSHVQTLLGKTRRHHGSERSHHPPILICSWLQMRFISILQMRYGSHRPVHRKLEMSFWVMSS